MRAQAVDGGPAAGTGVSDVWQVRVSDVAYRGAGRAVVRAVLRPKSPGVVSRRRGDHVLYARILGAGSIAEVLRGANGFGRELRLAGVWRGEGRGVNKKTGKKGRRVGVGRGACGGRRENLVG